MPVNEIFGDEGKMLCYNKEKNAKEHLYGTHSLV